jgi:hypothetical protein
VAAGEHQALPVVVHGALVGRLVAGVQERGLGLAIVAGRLAAEAVDWLRAVVMIRPAGLGGSPAGGSPSGRMTLSRYRFIPECLL